MATVQCDKCGVVFTKKLSDVAKRNFCSLKCAHGSLSGKDNHNYRGGKMCKCVICGNKHYRKPCHMENKTPFACSRKCSGKVHSMIHSGTNGTNYKNALNTHTCLICRIDFTSYHKKRKYCSVKCKSLHQQKQIKLTCKKCGVDFKKPQSYIFWHNQRGSKNFFCSVSCRQKHNIGTNHHCWIKDRDKLKDRRKTSRESHKMKEWKKSVFERDGYTCQMCLGLSKKGNNIVLNAHHIRKFSTNKGLRYEINNGITLCDKCHKKTYHKEELFEEKCFYILNKNHSARHGINLVG